MAVEYLALVADKLAGSVGVLAHLAIVQLLRLISGITLETA